MKIVLPPCAHFHSRVFLILPLFSGTQEKKKEKKKKKKDKPVQPFVCAARTLFLFYLWFIFLLLWFCDSSSVGENVAKFGLTIASVKANLTVGHLKGTLTMNPILYLFFQGKNNSDICFTFSHYSHTFIKKKLCKYFVLNRATLDDVSAVELRLLVFCKSQACGWATGLQRRPSPAKRIRTNQWHTFPQTKLNGAEKSHRATTLLWSK
jgi:hypothetical protein